MLLGPFPFEGTVQTLSSLAHVKETTKHERALSLKGLAEPVIKWLQSFCAS